MNRREGREYPSSSFSLADFLLADMVWRPFWRQVCVVVDMQAVPDSNRTTCCLSIKVWDPSGRILQRKAGWVRDRHTHACLQQLPNNRCSPQYDRLLSAKSLRGH